MADTLEVGYDEICGALAAKDMQPLWTQAARLMPPKPIPATLPWLWKWTTVLPLAEQAGRLITIERGGERRVLALANPGLGGLPYTSSSLWGAVQYLGPHEAAPAHRHTPSAIRFVMQGSGVWTTVDGVACDMKPGDLVLTPNWSWHDHTNAGDEPMAWFDGLDLPLVAGLESVFFETYPELMQRVEAKNSALLRFPYEEADRRLTDELAAGGGPSATLVYRRPDTGGHAVPTIGCQLQRLLPGARTAARRQAGSSIHVVFKGRGATVINGQRFDWERGDIFVVPSWAAVDFEAAEPSDLFAVNDRPVLEALGLYREEVLPEAQPVTGAFQPK